MASLSRMTCANYHFNETIFSLSVGKELVLEERHKIIWNALTLTYLNLRTNQCKLKVQRIIHLQNLANQLPNAFIDTKKVKKSFSLT